MYGVAAVAGGAMTASATDAAKEQETRSERMEAESENRLVM
jgi:hypothetical protein